MFKMFDVVLIHHPCIMPVCYIRVKSRNIECASQDKHIRKYCLHKISLYDSDILILFSSLCSVPWTHLQNLLLKIQLNRELKMNANKHESCYQKKKYHWLINIRNLFLTGLDMAKPRSRPGETGYLGKIHFLVHRWQISQ